MARNTADVCIFCMQNPCRCGKPDKPKAAPRKLSTSPVATPAPSRTSGRPLDGAPSEVGSNAVVASAAASPPTRRPNLASVARVKNTELEALAYAVTCFAEKDMLHRDSLVEHRDLIRLPAYRIDAMIWKQDNVDTVQRQ